MKKEEQEFMAPEKQPGCDTEEACSKTPTLTSTQPLGDVLSDARWLMERLNSSEIKEYRGRYVAIAGKRVLGSGEDPLSLRQELAKSHGVQPNRLFITFIDDCDAVRSEA